MHRFMRDLLTFLGIQFMILIAVVSIFPAREQLYPAAMIDKLERLRTTPPPRIIFVSGSSLVMGLDCFEVRKELGYEPVNMAGQVNLGDRFLLAQVDDEIQAGDIIVLAMEAAMLPADLEGEGIALLELALMHWAGSIRYIRNPAQWKAMLNSGLVVFHRLTEMAPRSIRERLSRWRRADDSKPTAPDHYLSFHPLCHLCTKGPPFERWSCNVFGDHVAHWGLPPVEFKDSPIPISSDPAIQHPTFERLNRFARRCRKKGATVVYVFPPFSEDSFKIHAQWLSAIEEEMREHLDIPILGRLEDTVYPRRFYYDLALHLTGEGVTMYTSHIIERLREILPEGPLMKTDQAIPCPPRPVQVVSDWPDGWIGASARVCVHRPCTPTDVRLKVSCATPEELLPVEVVAWSGKQRIARLRFEVDSRNGILVLPLETDVQDEFVHFDLEVDRTFVPNEFNPKSQDTRALGVRVTIDQ